MTWKEKLKALHPCPEAYRWACQYTTLKEAWLACEHPHWMRWLTYRCDPAGMCGDAYALLLEIGALGAHGDQAWDLHTTYMFLDFMPDPPVLP